MVSFCAEFAPGSLCCTPPRGASEADDQSICLNAPRRDSSTTSSTSTLAEMTPSSRKLTHCGAAQGNWRDKHFTYTTADGHVVASTIVQGRFSGVVNFMTGNDSYILTAEPGGDLAFLTTCTIALNDILHPDMA